MCNFYTIIAATITPQSRTTIGETCPKEIQIVDSYLVVSCSSVKSVLLYKIDSSYKITRKLFLSGIDNNDAKYVKIDSKTSMLLYSKSHAWSQGQTAPLTFIDSAVILFDSPLSGSRPYAIRFEQDFFYEIHANSIASWTYNTHIKTQHTDLSGSYGSIVKFSAAGSQLTLIT